MRTEMLTCPVGRDPVGDYIASLAAPAPQRCYDTVKEIKAWRRGYEKLARAAARAERARFKKRRARTKWTAAVQRLCSRPPR